MAVKVIKVFLSSSPVHQLLTAIGILTTWLLLLSVTLIGICMGFVLDCKTG